jgi:hypothetical protein
MTTASSVKLDRDRSCAPGGLSGRIPSMLNVSSSRVIHRVYDIVRKRRNRRHSINTVSGDVAGPCRKARSMPRGSKISRDGGCAARGRQDAGALARRERPGICD